MDMIYRRRGLMATPHIERITGAVASFNSGYNKIPLKSLICNIEPIQAGSGVPSPENVRPISGRTGVKVQKTGKNLLNLAESEMISDGWDRIFPISVKAGTYIISCQNQFGASTKGAGVSLTDENDTTIAALTRGYIFGDVSFVGVVCTITAEQAKKIKNIIFACRAGGTTFNDIAQGNIQLELGSTATSYEPYKGSEVSVNWETEAGTVYGGTLDVVSGKLTVDMAMVDLGTLAWSYSTDNVLRFGASFPSEAKHTSLAVALKGLSSMYRVVPFEKLYDPSLSQNGLLASFSATRMAVRNDAYTDAAAFKTAMSGVQLVYELATSITVQLTPQEVSTLLGENNIWCDSGDVSVDYWKWGN